MGRLALLLAAALGATHAAAHRHLLQGLTSGVTQHGNPTRSDLIELR